MSQKQVLLLSISVTLVMLFSFGCGSPTVKPVSEPLAATPTPEPPAATPTPEPPAATPTPEPPAATPTPEPPAATPTPTIPIPEGLLPSTLTPSFFESLYQQAISKASLDIPGTNFEQIRVEVYPFGPSLWDTELEVRFIFYNTGNINFYFYEWTDKTNDLAFHKAKRQLVFLIGGKESGSCKTLPWQREEGWEELIRYGYSKVHESFPPNANSHYVLFAGVWDGECRWQAEFWNDFEIAGEFVLNESGPSTKVVD